MELAAGGEDALQATAAVAADPRARHSIQTRCRSGRAAAALAERGTRASYAILAPSVERTTSDERRREEGVRAKGRCAPLLSCSHATSSDAQVVYTHSNRTF